MKKAQNLFGRFCAALTLALFAGVFLGGSVRGHLAPAYALGGLALFALLALAARFLLPEGGPLERLSAGAWRGIWGGGLALLALLMLLCGAALLNDNYTAPFDTEAVTRTAIQLAQGIVPADYNDYFICCDSNVFCMFAQFLVCRVVFLLGGRQYSFWVMVLNTGLLWLAPFFLCKAAALLWGRRGGALALLISFLFLPYCIFSSFVYTDPMAAGLLAGCLYQALALDRRWAGLCVRQRVLGVALLGLLLPCAFLMKGSSAVLYIALALWFGLRPGVWRQARTLLACAGGVLLLSAAVIGGFKAVERNCGLLDFSGYDAYHMPVTHWVMMGLENDGAYNGESFAYSGKFTTVAEREQAIAARLGTNLAALLRSPVAALWLFDTKAETCWLDGLFSAPAMSAMSPKDPESPLGQWFWPGGAHFSAVNTFGQSFYLALWLAAFCALARLAFCRARPDSLLPAGLPALCLLGAFCFFSLWEANARYPFSFSVCLLLCACGGLLHTNNKQEVHPLGKR